MVPNGLGQAAPESRLVAQEGGMCRWIGAAAEQRSRLQAADCLKGHVPKHRGKQGGWGRRQRGQWGVEGLAAALTA